MPSVVAFIEHTSLLVDTKPERTQLVCFCREITGDADVKEKQIPTCLIKQITVELKAVNYESINYTSVSVFVFTVTCQTSLTQHRLKYIMAKTNKTLLI